MKISETEEDEDFGHSNYSLQVIQERMEYHKRAMRDLLTCQNTFAPISRLPVELLTKIFAHCLPQPPRHSRLGGTPPFKDLHDKLSITHVCYQWRKVALACPTLWACTVVTNCQDYMEAVLDRSGEATLMVYASSSYKILPGPSFTTLTMVLAHMHRIRIFQMGVLKSTFRMLEQVLAKPAPLLEELILFDVVDTSNGPLPPLLKFRADLPNLRILEISGYQFQSLRSIFRPSVTSLYIDTYSEIPTNIPLTALLAVMEEMPLLETFRFGCLHFPCPAFPTANTVQMNHLRSLSLNTSGNSALWLLDHLRLPVLSSICLDGVGDDSMEHRCLILNTVVSRVLGAQTENPSYVGSLAVDNIPDTETTRVRGWTAVHSAESIWHDGPPSQFDITLSGIGLFDEVVGYNVMEALLNCPFVSSIRTLSVGIKYLIDEDGHAGAVTQLVHSLPNITSLGLSNWTEHGAALLVASECNDSSAEGVNEENNTLFPSLDTLFLRGVTFSSSYHPSPIDTLAIALKERRTRLTG